MSIILPPVVLAQAAFIVWLLGARTRRNRLVQSSGTAGQEEWLRRMKAALMPHVEERRFPLLPGKKVVDTFALSKPPEISDTRAVECGPDHVPTAEKTLPPREQLARQRLTGRFRAAMTRGIRWAGMRRRGSRTHHDGKPQQWVEAGTMHLRGLGESCFPELWELLPLGILVLDERGEILFANERTEKAFGYARGELIGEPVSRLVPEFWIDGRSAYQEGFLTMLAALPAKSVPNLNARRKDLSTFPAEIRFLRTAFKDERAILAFIEDRTDYYALLRNQQDLAHVTRVSTIGELAGSLAHELNQPLTAILSNVQAALRFMAAEPVDVAEVREILNDVVQDDYRASEIIRRVRAVVKKGDPEFVLLDLASVIHDVVLLLHSDAIFRQTQVIVDIAADHPTIYADKVQLQQVTLNLILNAFDAMSDVSPSGRVVSVTLTQQSGGMVRIAVRDCGHGLAVGELDSVFTPFYTSKPHGLGLGLSISRSIVELHGGQLWVENNLDRGATFYVTLPTGNVVEHKESR
ncbi:ATP-binding protein [Paraburkholderia sp. RL18-103-BIB-C]|uniref:sensor histidine kinase n=1 Tax=unclassified Paraburkholderia TaxID=2615204 RepID=UPI0038BCF8DD